MTEQTVVDLGARAIWIAIQVAAPALLATLLTGIVISIVQAATQINEQTLTFIPKIIVMTAALVFFGPWILHTMMNFTIEMFTKIPGVTR